VRSTHERVDGGGYPDALEGPDIPIGSRIIAVCDAFDAMTSDRSYSSRRTVGAALAELERCAGTQFDPDVVDAFMSLAEIASGPSQRKHVKPCARPLTPSGPRDLHGPTHSRPRQTVAPKPLPPVQTHA
jgi:HD-GYP domain-containing protein (c-di-GMP phosphodiesterase class II)